MDLTRKLRQGMRVVGADEREYGRVDRYDDAGVYIGGRAIPYSAFERVDRDQLYVGQGGARYFDADPEARVVAQEGEVRVPLVEERLAVDTRTVELGHLAVRKTVEPEQVSVPVELRRDQVEVRQVDVENRPTTIGEVMDAFKEDAIRVPVRGEEIAVSKEAVVTGEVAVGRELVGERHTISDTLRQEVIDIDTSDGEARQESGERLDRLRSRLHEAGGPTFRARDLADADLTYRVDPDTRDGSRHADRVLDDVESGLEERDEADDALPGEPDEVLRVTEAEEHLRVERRRIALGFVEIRKTVVTEHVMVPVELKREVVEYRLIDDPGGVATIPEAPGDLKDDTIRIPVFREKPVIHKEIIVTSEVVIDRTLTTERQTLEETLRRTTVTVDDETAEWVPVRRQPEDGGVLEAERGEINQPTDWRDRGTEGNEAGARQAGIRPGG